MVNLLTNKISLASYNGSLVERYKNMIKRNMKVEIIKHIYREANNAADCMKNRAMRRMSEYHFLNHLPNALIPIIQADAEGVSCLHMAH